MGDEDISIDYFQKKTDLLLPDKIADSMKKQRTTVQHSSVVETIITQKYLSSINYYHSGGLNETQTS